MATTRIILKNSSVEDKEPLATDLNHGELAVNYHTNNPGVFLKDSTNSIVQIAGIGALPTASETVAGIAEIATTAEVTAGTDDTTIITPAKLAAAIPTAQDLQSVCDEGDSTTTSIEAAGFTATASGTDNIFAGDVYIDAAGSSSPAALSLLNTGEVEGRNIECNRVSTAQPPVDTDYVWDGKLNGTTTSSITSGGEAIFNGSVRLSRVPGATSNYIESNSTDGLIRVTSNNTKWALATDGSAEFASGEMTISSNGYIDLVRGVEVTSDGTAADNATFNIVSNNSTGAETASIRADGYIRLETLDVGNNQGSEASTGWYLQDDGMGYMFTADTTDVIKIRSRQGQGNVTAVENVTISSSGSAVFKYHGTFGDSTTMASGGGVKVYRNRTSPNDIVRINIGESDTQAVWENSGNFVINYDGSISLGSGTTEIDTGGNMQIDGSINVGGDVAQGNAGVLTDGGGSVQVTRDTGTDNVWIGQLSGANTSEITAAGAATFTARTQIGTGTLSDVALALYNDTTDASEPTLYIQNDQDGGNLLQGFGDGSEKVLITGAGNATFAGYLRTKDAAAQTSTYVQADGTDGITIVNANNTKATIDMDGVAEFASSIQSGGDPWNGAAVGSKLYADGAIALNSTTGANTLLNVFNGSSTKTAYITAAGTISATTYDLASLSSLP